MKVFLVDDSAVVRQMVAHILSDQDEFLLIGAAANPLLAMSAISKRRPDILLLDIEMPSMDGLTFLRQQIGKDPIPTVICSTLTGKGSRMAIDALASGAVAVVGKPAQGLKSDLVTFRHDLMSALRSAAKVKPVRRTLANNDRKSPHQTKQTDGLNNRSLVNQIDCGPIVIGSSTGGTQAIEHILRELPANLPGIAITQHMPENFTRMFAQRLDSLCDLQIREAKDGDRLENGVVLIAPGGRHMALKKGPGYYCVEVADGPQVNRHKPSVDVLFNSTAKVAGHTALGIILTGMGDDGARGLKAMHRAGAKTIAQNEETCVVFGMPMEAIKLGAVDWTLPLNDIAHAIQKFAMFENS